jgi:putative intracellular protease/amidase
MAANAHWRFLKSLVPAMFRSPVFPAILASLLVGALLCVPSARADDATTGTATAGPPTGFAPYIARNGHARPLVAVVGDNAGAELTDFVVPYAVLQRSGAADLLAVSTRPGPMTMRPALRLRPDTDLDGFDAWHPEGADYIVVPAMVRQDEPKLLAWLRAQYAKGATIVSICDGALVVANAGLLEGHRATAHWATEKYRRKTWPKTAWVANTRYVVDGRIASSAGISAAIPTSLALVEAIAGHDRAARVGATLGVDEWGTAHDSDAFGFGGANLWPLVQVNITNHWFHRRDRYEIALRPGIDDLALALTADAWSRTGRGEVRGVSAAAEVQGDTGLLWYADAEVPPGGRKPQALDLVRTVPGTSLFDTLLAAIDLRYGDATALGVALDFEYPWRLAGR